MSLAQKGEKSYFFGRKHSPESIEKMKLVNLGKPCKEETKEKLRQINLNKKQSIETINKRVSKINYYDINNQFKKQVNQFDLNLNLINTYNSIGEAFRETKVNNIPRCCNGEYKQAGGFIWKWKKQLIK